MVVGVGQVDEVRVGGGPGPGAGVGIAFDEDILRCGTGGADGGDGGLIEIEHEGLVFVVEFVVYLHHVSMWEIGGR